MDENNSSSSATLLAVGCGIAALLLIGVGFLFFTSARVSSSPTAPGTGVFELGYELRPGPVHVAEDGTRRATLHVEITPDWRIERFDLSNAELLVDGTSFPVKQIAVLPKLPEERDFDLIYEFSLPQEAEDPEAPERIQRLRIQVNSKAEASGFASRRTQSDRLFLFRVWPDRLEASGPQ